ncbi:COG1470 family protein [Streptomyces sp. IBSBF 3136]|uniref:COG1470 family protein n=1 Tax=Streptomyces sp. IBSBF 3136 TaxID=2903524 RepID=UPI002FDBB206
MPPAARVLGLTLLLLLASAPAARAATGWSVAPAGAGRPSFYAEGAPGAVLTDTVSVTNHGRRPLTVRLRGTGVLIAFARTTLRVPARTRAEVPFTVTVPVGAAPGDRPGTVTARDADGRTAAVALRLRVGGPALSALSVEHVAVRGDRITYELVNRGTTVLVPRLAVHADGVLGPVLDRPARTLPVRLPPGTRRTLGEPWPGRPALDAVDLRLTVTAAHGAHDSARASARFVPWGPVSGALGAVTAAAALPAVRRHRRHRRRRDADRDDAPARTRTGTPAEPTGAVT